VREKCTVSNCDTEAYIRGYCRKHYTRWKRHGDPHVLKNLPKGAEPYDSIIKHGYVRWGECLLYRGHSNGASGYGMTYGKQLAHRVSYTKWKGEIPTGYWVDHECHNVAAMAGLCNGGGSCLHRRCINPSHLILKTPSENCTSSPLTGGKTHCRHGHEFTEENTYIQPQYRGYGTARVCRTCRRLAYTLKHLHA